MSKNISIIGLGWLGEALALSLYKDGHTVCGSTTNLTKLKQLSQHPFYVGKINILSTEIIGDWQTIIENTDCLIINIPPRRIEDIETVYPSQMQQIINCTPSNIYVIFVSSTAVYGSNDTPFTETCSLNPEKSSGKAVLAAEKLLQNHFNENLTILRLAGLIGPNRHPGKFLAGKRSLKNGKTPVNLVHQTDCIRLIENIITQNCFGEIINGCASEHPLREDYYREASKKLDLPAPNFEEESETSGNKKIVDNTKSKELLNFTYLYDNCKI